MYNLRTVQVAIKLRKLSTAFGLKSRSLAQKVTPRSVVSNKTEDDEDNAPIHYFGSQAGTWRAKDTRSGGADKELWYQPFVISASLAVFLLYFCVFREENDIDRKLEGNLYDHVPALEEVQLSINYKYNKENGLDNREVITRLSEMGIDIKQLDTKIAEGRL